MWCVSDQRARVEDTFHFRGKSGGCRPASKHKNDCSKPGKGAFKAGQRFVSRIAAGQFNASVCRLTFRVDLLLDEGLERKGQVRFLNGVLRQPGMVGRFKVVLHAFDVLHLDL